MEKALSHIEIPLDHIKEGLVLSIDERTQNTLFDVEDASDNAEARYQLIEGHFYDFEFTDSKYFFKENVVVQAFQRKKYIGQLSPNIYVGTLELEIVNSENDKTIPLRLEVRSKKIDYRSDYRFMLEYITEKCTDLLLQRNTPVSQTFDVDPDTSYSSLYQRFSFLRSVIDSEEFDDAVNRIISFPVTAWEDNEELADVRKIRKVYSKQIRAIAASPDRIPLSKSHYLRSLGLSSLPSKFPLKGKTDHYDTTENRFVKHALETFLFACEEINALAKENTRLKKESEQTIIKLEEHLQHSFFRHIGRATTLKLNSPVLQRKEGYREVLRSWLMFDLAAKLIWKGGEDVYEAGKKNIANLYEYWLFFVLLDLVSGTFEIEPLELDKLIQQTKDGLGLQLKQGLHTAISGTFDEGTRKLKVEFNYNRSFNKTSSYPEPGSWTVKMQPDYTLSLWPAVLNRKQAEKEEVIVHIHFDAKYKVDGLTGFNEAINSESLNQEKEENRQGIYKNADLLKMHAYKDAIRRTSGAYVIYPGKGKNEELRGFHEIIPGLGAFAVRPDKDNIGTAELESFLKKVTNNLVDRISQREKLAYKTFDIMSKNRNGGQNILRETLPEIYGKSRQSLPDETFVLVGYCKNKKMYDWYLQNGLYNFRMDDDSGSLALTSDVSQAKYLLLRMKGEELTEALFEITEAGPKVFSGSKLQEIGYNSDNLKEHYLVVKIKKIDLDTFGNSTWSFKNLKGYLEVLKKEKNIYKQPAIPFTTTLSELMQHRITPKQN